MTDKELREQILKNGKDHGLAHYCSTTWHQAYLSEEFGKNYAMKLTGMTEEELEKIVGRNSKGKRKGLLKGMIKWEKVIVGGWYRVGYGERNGFVAVPNQIINLEIVDYWKQGDPLFKLSYWEISRIKDGCKIN